MRTSLDKRGEVISGVGVQPPCTGSTSQTSTANGAYLTSTGHSFEGVFRATRGRILLVLASLKRLLIFS